MHWLDPFLNSGPSDVIFLLLLLLVLLGKNKCSPLSSLASLKALRMFINLALRSLLLYSDLFFFPPSSNVVNDRRADIFPPLDELTWKTSQRERKHQSQKENIINGILKKHISIKGIRIHTHTWDLTEKHQRQKKSWNSFSGVEEREGAKIQSEISLLFPYPWLHNAFNAFYDQTLASKSCERDFHFATLLLSLPHKCVI